MAHNSDYVDAAAVVAQVWSEPDRAKFGLTGRADIIWLGHLAGFTVDASLDAHVYLVHIACERRELLRETLAGSYLANIVGQALEHKCPEAGRG